MHLDGAGRRERSPVQIAGKDPNCAALGSWAGRFEQRGGVRGAQVSLIKKARAMAGRIVGAVVLGISLRGLSSR